MGTPDGWRAHASTSQPETAPTTSATSVRDESTFDAALLAAVVDGFKLPPAGYGQLYAEGIEGTDVLVVVMLPEGSDSLVAVNVAL